MPIASDRVTLHERAPGIFRLRIEGPRKEGKRSFTYETFHGSYFEAEERRLQKVREVRALPPPVRVVKKQYPTVAEYLEGWVESRRRLGTISESTAEWYTRINHHVIARLGVLPLNKVATQDIQELYDELSCKLAPQTVRHIHARLINAFEDACVDGILKSNPVKSKKIKLPKVVPAKTETLSQEEVRSFLAYVKEHEPFLWPLCVTAAATGLRRGELAALRVKDIHFDKSALTVMRTVVTIGRLPHIKRPKTQSSIRTISIPPFLLTILSPLTAKKKPDDLLFTNPYGDVWSLNALTHRVNRALEGAGLGRFTLHDLRHAHATVLLQNKMPVKVVSQRLGHADVVITMRTYQHVIPRDDEALAALTQSLMAEDADEVPS
jgi:integrase